jgi:hypothetical protein
MSTLLDLIGGPIRQLTRLRSPQGIISQRDK